MEIAKLSVLLLVLIFSFRVSNAVPSTQIVPEANYMGRAIIVLPEEENATVTVQCLSFQNNDLRQTSWFIQRPGEDLEQIIFQVDNDSFVIDGDTFQNLTIITVTQDLDRAEILCGPLTEELESRFLLGFEATALLDSAGIISTMEGSDRMVALEAADNDPFPPLVTFLWMHNGIELSSSERISLNGYNITITNVEREDNGEYQLVVSNNAGFGEGNFTLDVQFGPIATDVSVSPVYFAPGINVTLVAFIDIGGNPNPSSIWTVNSAALSTDIRFNTSVAGQLSITNISSADGGMYTCTLSNGIGPDLSATIELLEAVLPTMPQNVEANEVNSTSVRLVWGAPSDQGTFSISFYRVRLVSTPHGETIETNETNVLISELLPGTEYTVTVVAVTSGVIFLPQEGAESLPVMFNTSVSAPLFKEVIVVNSEGFISISWTFVHSGGLDIISIESVCNVERSIMSGNDLTYTTSCAEMNMCSNESLMGSTLLGPVQAGVVYTCTVTAVNAIGFDVEKKENITSDIGIPSTPEIVGLAVLPGQVVLTVKTVSPGGTEIQFNITVCTSTDMVYSTLTFSVSAYDPIEGADFTVSVPNGGSFSFHVLSFNTFGSLGTVDSFQVMKVPPGILTETTVSMTVQSTNVPGVEDCSLVAGLSVTLTLLVTAILSSLVTLVVTMCLCVRVKKTKTTPTIPTHLYEIPSSCSGKESPKMSPNVAYGHVQPQSTAQISSEYDNVDL